MRRDEVILDAEGNLAVLASGSGEGQTAETLNQVWYALLMGWAGGVHGQSSMLEKMRSSAELILRGSAREL